jgi:hypothetical protein
MKTVLVNFANALFAPYQVINSLTGRRFGFDECRSFGPEDIDDAFARRNAETLGASRGAGYWLWKPYVVAKTLEELVDGDIVFYADSATHFVNSIDPMVDLLDRSALDLLILGEGFVEAQYTKRDAFVLMQLDDESYVRSPQRFASCFMVRRSPWSSNFLAQYLTFAENDRILTDRSNQCGLPNYPDFVGHRHDQSIFSLLSKKNRIPIVAADVIVEGLPARDSQIINHTRRHKSPGEIVRYLLAQGVLSAADLKDLRPPAGQSIDFPS